MSEASVDGFAGLGVGGVAKELAGGGVDESVAAVEYGDRRQGLEAGGGVADARGAGSEVGEGETMEGLAGGFQATPGAGEADRGVLACDARGEGGEPIGAHAQAACGGGLEAVAEVVEALAAAADESL